jgi:hypothetical protein
VINQTPAASIVDRTETQVLAGIEAGIKVLLRMLRMLPTLHRIWYSASATSNFPRQGELNHDPCV